MGGREGRRGCRGNYRIPRNASRTAAFCKQSTSVVDIGGQCAMGAYANCHKCNKWICIADGMWLRTVHEWRERKRASSESAESAESEERRRSDAANNSIHTRARGRRICVCQSVSCVLIEGALVVVNSCRFLFRTQLFSADFLRSENLQTKAPSHHVRLVHCARLGRPEIG